MGCAWSDENAAQCRRRARAAKGEGRRAGARATRLMSTEIFKRVLDSIHCGKFFLRDDDAAVPPQGFGMSDSIIEGLRAALEQTLQIVSSADPPK